MARYTAVLMLILFLSTGCTKPQPVAVVPEGDGGNSDGKEATGPVLQGLTAAERERFYHLDQGGEIIPLDWLRALQSQDTGKPFLENMDRFGLLPDPDNADGLPVGLSAAESRDLRFSGKMVGITCAACHVGEFTWKGQSTRSLGSPNVFNSDFFRKDLGDSIKATLQSPSNVIAFLHRLLEQKGYKDRLAALRPQAAKILDAFPDLDSIKQGGKLEQALAQQIEALHQKILDAPTLDLHSGLTLKKDSSDPATGLKGVLQDVRDDLKDLLNKEPGAGGPIARAIADAKGETALGETLDQIRETVTLLKARIDLARKLGGETGLAVTPAGPARGDDWAIIGNQLLPSEFAIPVTAPLKFPSIWDINKHKFIHYDHNTTLVMDRNIGEAIGTGAMFDPKTFASTVPTRNLHELETLARKIRWPAWPKALGPIDKVKAERGAGLYQTHCVKCHVIDPQVVPDLLYELDEIKTDPNRAVLFKRKINDQPLATVLGATSGSYKKWAYQRESVTDAEQKEMEGLYPEEWRTTVKYAARPLTGVWASPPYLHNGSVPTLYHLLLPAAKRPTTFPLGHREYDPVKVGYVTEIAGKSRFVMDTTQDGNRNTGHEYGTDLAEDDRLALLEYLKGI